MTVANPDIGMQYVLVHGVDLEKWCKKWDLEVFTADCPDCDRINEANQPFASKGRRGLLAKPCKCGSDNAVFTYIDISFDEINMNSLIGFNYDFEPNQTPRLKIVEEPKETP